MFKPHSFIDLIKIYSPQLFWMMVSYFKETNAVSKLLWSFNHNLLLPCVQELRFVTLLQNILDLFNNTIYLSFCLRFIFRSTGFETGRRPVSFPLDNEYSNVVFGLTTHPTNLKGVIFLCALSKFAFKHVQKVWEFKWRQHNKPRFYFFYNALIIFSKFQEI